MKIPFLASLLILLVGYMHYKIHQNTRRHATEAESFWEKESRANSTRKKPLDNLDYITIPLSTLPTKLLRDNEEVMECIDIMESLNSCKIVNLTGISNTDLKLEYGTANITVLMEYDQNYTLLARTLQKWASLLYENGHVTEARTILEFAISTRTDISGTYSLLCKIYTEQGCPEKKEELLVVANTLQSAMKKTIVRIVQESCP